MEEMTKHNVVKKVLSDYGMMTSSQISMKANTDYNFLIYPASVAGILRSWCTKGLAASSNCGNGKTVYWLNKEYWNDEADS